MKRKPCLGLWLLVLYCIIVLGGAPSALARNWSSEFTLGPEWCQGNTTYKVKGLWYYTSGPSFESTLEFPLDAWYITGRGRFRLGERWSCNIAVKKNMTGDPGTMTDSDVIHPGNELYIYSKSEAELDALICSGKIRYRFYEMPDFFFGRKCSVFVGLGCLYQRFDYDIYNTRQTYPSTGDPPVYCSGQTLQYSVEYFIPYLEMAVGLQVFDHLTIDLAFGYSTHVRAVDEDDHLLRNQHSESDCDGRGVIMSAEAAYRFTSRWSTTVSLSHLDVKATGDSDTYENGTYSHTLDQEITSEQTAVKLVGSYHF